MYIIDYLKEEAIFLRMKGKKKKDIIKELLLLSAKNGIIREDKVDNIFAQIMERENQGSTGIGNGIGIPHCKSEAVEHGVIIAATFPEGIKFHSIDGKPVYLIFLFVFPTSESKEYLQVLAKIARILSDENIRNKLILAETSKDFREIIAKNDVIPIVKGKEGKYVFILALNDPNRMQDVISNLVEIGAQTSLIVDSETLEKKMAYDIPIFAGLTYFKGKSPYSKTFIGILNSSEQVDYLNQLLLKENIDLSKPGAGFLLAMEAKKIIGGVPEEIEV